MNYAIIELLGKQYQVKPGDKITVNGTLGQENDPVTEGKILLIKNGTVTVGTPYIEGEIALKVVAQTKSEKIRVSTYKSKSRLRRVTGHRQGQTILEVVAVGSLKTEAETPAKKTPAKKKATK